MDGDFTKKDELIARITRTVLADLPTWQKEYDEYEDGYKYLAGDQYKPEVREWWETQRRPARTYNIVFPMFNQVLGDFLLNDQKTRVFPLPSGDPQISETFEDLLDHTNEENDYKYIYAQWALAGIIKRGFIFPRFSNERHVDGSIVFSNVDEFEVGFDPDASDYFLDDARYIYRSRFMTTEEIFRFWPHHKSRLKEFLRNRDEIITNSDQEVSPLLSNTNFVDERNGKYRVLEFHEFEYRDAQVAINTRTGQAEVITLEGRKLDAFLRFNPDVRIVERPNQKIKVVRSILPGMNYMLDDSESDIQDGTYDIIPYSAYNYAKRAINNFGVFRNAKEPQDSFNEWENTGEDLIKRTTAPGQIMRPEYIDNYKDVELYGRQPDLTIKVNADSNISLDQVYKMRDIPKTPFALDAKMQQAYDFFQKVTGVTANQMGLQETKAENASLFAQRVRQAKVALQVMYHNWSRSKRRLDDKKIRLMQENYNGERYFLITTKTEYGRYDMKKVEINKRIGNVVLNDITQGRYRVIPEDTDRNPTARAVRFMQKTEIVQMIVNWYGPQALDIEWWLSDSDLGDMDKLIQKVNEVMGQQAEAEAEQKALGLGSAMQEMARKQLELEGGGGLAGDSPAPRQ